MRVDNRDVDQTNISVVPSTERNLEDSSLRLQTVSIRREETLTNRKKARYPTIRISEENIEESLDRLKTLIERLSKLTENYHKIQIKIVLESGEAAFQAGRLIHKLGKLRKQLEQGGDSIFDEPTRINIELSCSKDKKEVVQKGLEYGSRVVINRKKGKIYYPLQDLSERGVRKEFVRIKKLASYCQRTGRTLSVELPKLAKPILREVDLPSNICDVDWKKRVSSQMASRIYRNLSRLKKEFGSTLRFSARKGVLETLNSAYRGYFIRGSRKIIVKPAPEGASPALWKVDTLKKLNQLLMDIRNIRSERELYSENGPVSGLVAAPQWGVVVKGFNSLDPEIKELLLEIRKEHELQKKKHSGTVYPKDVVVAKTREGGSESRWRKGLGIVRRRVRDVFTRVA